MGIKRLLAGELYRLHIREVILSGLVGYTPPWQLMKIINAAPVQKAPIFFRVLFSFVPLRVGLTLHLYPNPTTGSALLSGVLAKATVFLFNVLGARIATTTADATGAPTLLAGLSPGLYLVRADAATLR
jgi:hypothetical protein